MSLSNPYPEVSGNYVEEKAGKLLEPVVVNVSKRTASSRHTMTDARMNSETVTASTSSDEYSVFLLLLYS